MRLADIKTQNELQLVLNLMTSSSLFENWLKYFFGNKYRYTLPNKIKATHYEE